MWTHQIQPQILRKKKKWMKLRLLSESIQCVLLELSVMYHVCRVQSPWASVQLQLRGSVGETEKFVCFHITTFTIKFCDGEQTQHLS